jgi:hypothetical protein
VRSRTRSEGSPPRRSRGLPSTPEHLTLIVLHWQRQPDQAGIREWFSRGVHIGNAESIAALALWLEHDTSRRRHSALACLPPIGRLSPT